MPTRDVASPLSISRRSDLPRPTSFSLNQTVASLAFGSRTARSHSRSDHPRRGRGTDRDAPGEYAPAPRPCVPEAQPIATRQRCTTPIPHCEFDATAHRWPTRLCQRTRPGRTHRPAAGGDWRSVGRSVRVGGTVRRSVSAYRAVRGTARRAMPVDGRCTTGHDSMLGVAYDIRSSARGDHRSALRLRSSRIHRLALSSPPA